MVNSLSYLLPTLGEAGWTRDQKIAILGLIATLLTFLAASWISWVAYRLSKRASRNDLIFEVRSWADEVVNLLSEASVTCELDPKKDPAGFFMLRHALLHKLSALLDRGRFFFPNYYREDMGLGKPGAFRGVRPQILDLLKLAYALTREIDYKSQQANVCRREAFVEVKRHFVSVVQQAVDFRQAPQRALQYEQRLAGLLVGHLPVWVAAEAGTEKTFGGLCFSPPLHCPHRESHERDTVRPRE